MAFFSPSDAHPPHKLLCTMIKSVAKSKLEFIWLISFFLHEISCPYKNSIYFIMIMTYIFSSVNISMSMRWPSSVHASIVVYHHFDRFQCMNIHLGNSGNRFSRVYVRVIACTIAHSVKPARACHLICHHEIHRISELLSLYTYSMYNTHIYVLNIYILFICLCIKMYLNWLSHR